MRRRGSLREIGRRAPTRTPRARILLVCEGEKTERIYFSLYLGRLRAANVSLEIAKRECGSDPLSIVRYAKSLMKRDPGVDQCYCIIDRDSHAHFEAAAQEAIDYQRSLGERKIFETIKSFPCFEFWFILHFTFTTCPFVRRGRLSPGDAVVTDLRKFEPRYEKNNIQVIAGFLDDTDTAIANAERVLAEAAKSGNFNPSTEVHKVVKKLQSFL